VGLAGRVTLVQGDRRLPGHCRSRSARQTARDGPSFHSDAVLASRPLGLRTGSAIVWAKGTATVFDREALRELGAHPIHRQSFSLPVLSSPGTRR